MSRSLTHHPSGTSGVGGDRELKRPVTGSHPKKTKRLMDREIKRCLRTGDHDHNFAGWPGNNYLSRVKAAKQAMEDALVAEVKRMEAGQAPTSWCTKPPCLPQLEARAGGPAPHSIPGMAAGHRFRQARGVSPTPTTPTAGSSSGPRTRPSGDGCTPSTPSRGCPTPIASTKTSSSTFWPRPWPQQTGGSGYSSAAHRPSDFPDQCGSRRPPTKRSSELAAARPMTSKKSECPRCLSPT